MLFDAVAYVMRDARPYYAAWWNWAARSRSTTSFDRLNPHR
jgi:hypothetical protein